MIDVSFVEKIEEMAGVEVLSIDSRPYSSKTLHPITRPSAISIGGYTLTGVIAFLESDDFSMPFPPLVAASPLDATSDEDTAEALPAQLELVADTRNRLPIVHVVDYDSVNVISPIFGEWRQRETLLKVHAHETDHSFGRFLALDDFIIYLQACFVQDETTAAILAIVGNITEGAERQTSDDGITQNVTTRAGVTRVNEVAVPNPVVLRPYRIFPDVEQPASKFILRINAGRNGAGATCALFEGDGGGWKIEAIKTIKTWLSEKLAADIKVIA